MNGNGNQSPLAVLDPRQTMSRDIPVALIDADPDQPRKHFDESALQEMADSLTANGQIVPITVRPVAGALGARFVIVQGERRWRGAQLAGLPTLRAEVADIAPDAAYLLALIENIQRADLTPLEEAAAYQRLLANGFNQTSLGQRIGKSQSYIATKLRMLTLPASIQNLIDEGKFSEGHAKQILRLPSDLREAVAQKAVSNSFPISVLRAFVDVCLIMPSYVHLGEGDPQQRHQELFAIPNSIEGLRTLVPLIRNMNIVWEYFRVRTAEDKDAFWAEFADLEKSAGRRITARDVQKWGTDITVEESEEIIRLANECRAEWEGKDYRHHGRRRRSSLMGAAPSTMSRDIDSQPEESQAVPA